MTPSTLYLKWKLITKSFRFSLILTSEHAFYKISKDNDTFTEVQCKWICNKNGWYHNKLLVEIDTAIEHQKPFIWLIYLYKNVMFKSFYIMQATLNFL